MFGRVKLHNLAERYREDARALLVSSRPNSDPPPQFTLDFFLPLTEQLGRGGSASVFPLSLGKEIQIAVKVYKDEGVLNRDLNLTSVADWKGDYAVSPWASFVGNGKAYYSSIKEKEEYGSFISLQNRIKHSYSSYIKHVGREELESRLLRACHDAMEIGCWNKSQGVDNLDEKQPDNSMVDGDERIIQIDGSNSVIREWNRDIEMSAKRRLLIGLIRPIADLPMKTAQDAFEENIYQGREMLQAAGISPDCFAFIEKIYKSDCSCSDAQAAFKDLIERQNGLIPSRIPQRSGSSVWASLLSQGHTSCRVAVPARLEIPITVVSTGKWSEIAAFAFDTLNEPSQLPAAFFDKSWVACSDPPGQFIAAIGKVDGNKLTLHVKIDHPGQYCAVVSVKGALSWSEETITCIASDNPKPDISPIRGVESRVPIQENPAADEEEEEEKEDQENVDPDAPAPVDKLPRDREPRLVDIERNLSTNGNYRRALAIAAAKVISAAVCVIGFPHHENSLESFKTWNKSFFSTTIHNLSKKTEDQTWKQKKAHLETEYLKLAACLETESSRDRIIRSIASKYHLSKTTIGSSSEAKTKAFSCAEFFTRVLAVFIDACGADVIVKDLKKERSWKFNIGGSQMTVTSSRQRERTPSGPGPEICWFKLHKSLSGWIRVLSTKDP